MTSVQTQLENTILIMHMKTRQHNQQAALRFIAGLLVLCIAATTSVAMASPPNEGQLTYWTDQGKVADKIANNGGGNGTSITSPIKIASAAELGYLAQQVNAGGKKLTVGGTDNANNSIDKESDSDYAGGFSGYYFELADDIELKEHYWVPIGKAETTGSSSFPSSITTTFYNFKGHFDGKGHTVKGLKIKMDGTDRVFAGLFGCVEEGTIQNLGVWLEGIEVSSTKSIATAIAIVGGIAGAIDNTTIRNCYVAYDATENNGVAKITGTACDTYVGGVIGYAIVSNNPSTNITHCYSTVDVEAKTNENNPIAIAGGIVGYLTGTLSYSYATGKVEATGNGKKWAGGICGGIRESSTSLKNCLALNQKITGSDNLSGRIVGGIYDNATYSSNYANPGMQVNEKTVADGSSSGNDGYENYSTDNGTSTYIELFKADLTSAPTENNGWNSGNWVWSETKTKPSSILLPQLKVVTIGSESSESHSDWPDSSDSPTQPSLVASDYLPKAPHLHIVQPNEGGTLTVKNGNTPITAEDTPLRPGTELTLSYTADDNYTFEHYKSGTSEGDIKTTVSGTSITIQSDLWLSASFTKKTPTPDPKYYLHIVQPTGGTLTVMDNKGTTITESTPLSPGTSLILSNTAKANYTFEHYKYGTSSTALDQTTKESSITMPSSDLWLSASFTYKEPTKPDPEPEPTPTPTIYYTVALPAVEGAVTDPVPGDYEVEAGDSFRFYLALDEAYNLSTPVVTTSRSETLVPRASDGAYVVKYVRSDVEIFIGGIEPNNPVDNETVTADSPRVWSAAGRLHLRTAAPTDVRIYTFDGSLRRAFRSDGGEQTLTLPTGSYIVVVGEVRYKVML